MVVEGEIYRVRSTTVDDGSGILPLFIYRMKAEA